ncbi:histidine phosphotransferase family protein [Breoghania sp.]|uniref:histidine phosphotransferase ChpT n=1 Tax=Breoghania sp. TaxID=2065378 RepID=UPI00261FF18C|nr:histidine phosphotransferase family protein [Breoghania sp.]MDJ0931908.1 histidine phosphotransferase family protein [Breoghania sp.]
MAKPIDLSSLDLAALIASRVCHDIISSVGAVTNGLEVLDEENNKDMREFAMDLIRKSARQASAKLQFARLAFGAAGSAGADIDLGDARSVAEGYMENEKSTLVWEVPRLLMGKNKVKLLLNLLLIANQCVPRGGTITVELTNGDAEKPSFRMTAEGLNARIPTMVINLINDQDVERIDAHAIQPAYASLLAGDSNMSISMEKRDDSVVITAE